MAATRLDRSAGGPPPPIGRTSKWARGPSPSASTIADAWPPMWAARWVRRDPAIGPDRHHPCPAVGARATGSASCTTRRSPHVRSDRCCMRPATTWTGSWSTTRRWTGPRRGLGRGSRERIAGASTGTAGWPGRWPRPPAGGLPGPDAATFAWTVDDFLYQAVWTAKRLRRGELWRANGRHRPLAEGAPADPHRLAGHGPSSRRDGPAGGPRDVRMGRARDRRRARRQLRRVGCRGHRAGDPRDPGPVRGGRLGTSREPMAGPTRRTVTVWCARGSMRASRSGHARRRPEGPTPLSSPRWPPRARCPPRWSPARRPRTARGTAGRTVHPSRGARHACRARRCGPARRRG